MKEPIILGAEPMMLVPILGKGPLPTGPEACSCKEFRGRGAGGSCDCGSIDGGGA